MGDRQPPPQPPGDATTAPETGSALVSKKRPEGLPPLPRRARDRALLMLGEQTLPGHKLVLLANVSRLQCRFEDADARLRNLGPVKGDEEPRQLVARVQDLARQIEGTVKAIFGDDAGDDPLLNLLGQRR